MPNRPSQVTRKAQNDIDVGRDTYGPKVAYDTTSIPILFSGNSSSEYNQTLKTPHRPLARVSRVSGLVPENPLHSGVASHDVYVGLDLVYQPRRKPCPELLGTDAHNSLSRNGRN